jgi:broad specificity phosphatase PhoE
LSVIYFFRHGQAGTRDNYDSLSDLGRRQAELLGDYLAAEGIEFQAAYAGAMARQQLTATAVATSYRSAGLPFPTLQTLPAWNEFDLDHVYSELAPLLAASDANFRSEYETMLEQVRTSNGRPDAKIHRRWSPCDIQVVDAWIRSLYPYSGESWDAFRQRVAGLRSSLNGTEGNVAVFTSATPTAIWAGLALDIHDSRLMALAGVLHNSSISVLRLREEQLLLFSFNGVPHLADAAMRTHR